jgi:H+/Cl- antiporter ClcA
MTGQTDTELAERGARRRARTLTVSAIFFIAMQVTHYGEFNGSRLVDQVKISAWFVWAIALLLVLATGGGLAGLWRGRKVRALMNDESTRAHRADALVWGFWAAMTGTILLYGVTMIDPTTTARDAIHLILTFGVGVAILRFGMLERRALKEG